MASFQVEVVSAERKIFSGEATAVFARSLEGEIGILPGHQPALLALDIAPIKIVLADGREERVAVHNGFLYYKPGDKLIVLADMAELASAIDVVRAQARLTELQRRAETEEDVMTEASIRKQTVRISVGG